MRILVLLLLLPLQLLICSLLKMPVTSATCHFPAIFNFGDSNSDTGGLSALYGALNPPFGETFFKKPSGRNSDGRLVIDFIGFHTAPFKEVKTCCFDDGEYNCKAVVPRGVNPAESSCDAIM